MISILKSAFIKFGIENGNQVSVERTQFICDTAAELPPVLQNSRKLYHGSIAYVIGEDALYVLNGSDEWVKEGE